ncbi:hypothetical protein NC651_008112 [Populus alba x Populus x berolinensis]|nr:hypothetical protein NC651_008112 [Populus alba x Populus x berolinensis]
MPVLRSQVLRGRGGEATPKQENKQKMLQEHRNNPDEVVEPIATRKRRRRAAAGAALDKELKAGNERVVVGVGVGAAVAVGTVKEEEEEEKKDLEVVGEKKPMNVFDSGGKGNDKPLAAGGEDDGTSAPIPDQLGDGDRYCL